MDAALQPPIGNTGLAPAANAPATEQLTAIASDVASDAGTLLEKHLALLRAEMVAGAQDAKYAGAMVAIGAGWMVAGGAFLLVAAIKLLQWLAPALPEWACWLIGGGVFLALGAGLLYAGYRLFSRVDLVPHRTLNNIQETWSWIVNRRT